jgi:glycosyltransferase involved in cell wall biosynthesis
MYNEERKKIVIITPSLDPTENISGISTISRLLDKKNKKYDYIPFVVGKKDNETRGLLWLIKFLKRPLELLLLNREKISLIHFNIGFEPKSILRDVVLFYVLFLKRIPIILHIHGGRFMNRRASGVYRFIIPVFLKKAQKVIVLSKIEKTFLLENYPGIQEQNIAIIPNAIVVPEYMVTEKKINAVLSIIFLGRIDKAKGLLKMADALKVLKEKGVGYTFYLCGVGDDKDWFLNLFSSDMSDHIKDMGLVFGEQKQKLLEQANIFLLPSDFEGLPLALLESMANYIVPVVSPVGSIPEVVNSSNGELIHSVEDIIEAIVKLNSDRNLLREKAERARETIEKDYSSTKFIERINAIYESVLS